MTLRVFSRMVVSLVLVAFLLVVGAGISQAAVINWGVGTGTYAWEPSTNWSPAQLPGSDDTAQVNNLNGSLQLALDGDRTVTNFFVSTDDNDPVGFNGSPTTVSLIDSTPSSLAAELVVIGQGEGGNEGTLRIGNNSTVILKNIDDGDPPRWNLTVGGSRDAVGNLNLDAGGTIRLGVSASDRASGIVVGRQFSGQNKTTEGYMTANNGSTFTAYMNVLDVGRNDNGDSVDDGDKSIGEFDLSAIVLGAGGNVLDANTVTVGYGGNGGLVDGTMTLGEGTARFGNLIVGRDAPSGDLGVGTGLVELQGTLIEIDAAEGIEVNRDGLIEALVSGVSAGFDLDVGSSLVIDPAGGLDLTFEDPDFGGLYFGLKWDGNHLADGDGLLSTLIDGGKITWTDNTTSQGVKAFYHSETGATYIGIVPEPGTLSLLLAAALMLAGLRRRRS